MADVTREAPSDPGEATRRRSHVPTRVEPTSADRRRYRRQERRLYRHARVESRGSVRIKQIALALFLIASPALLIYALVAYD